FLTRLLSSQQSRIATLSRKKNEFEEDIVKFQRYAEKLEAQRKACIERVEALAMQCQQTKEEMERVAAEREELASIVAAQDLSPEDVERICKAKASLEETLQSITAQKAEVEKTIWEREMSISKCMDDVERLIFQFNTLSTELRLTSVKKTKKERREGGAEKKETEETQICLPGLSFKAHAATAAEMMNVDLKGQVRTQLEAFHASLVSKVYKAQETELRVLDQLEANEDLVAERREEVQTLENLAQKLKQTYHQEKESLLSALRQKSQQTERLEKEAERLRQEAERLSKDSREKLSATNAELEKLQRKCEEEKEAVAECIFETLNVMMEHKSSVTTSLEALERYLRQEIALLEAAPSSASYEAVLDGIKG
ncbi:kinetochore-associated Ndc80 complex subunit ndc80, partial [Balamuthia mandrillaris]